MSNRRRERLQRMTAWRFVVILLLVWRDATCLSPDKSPLRLRTPNSSSLSATSTDGAELRVYDNVFDTATCRSLHDLTAEHTERTADGSSVFWRDGSQTLTPLETALDTCLRLIGDDDTSSGAVEYWSRREYIHIDCHSDVDERELLESGRILCPEWGHVLYLSAEKGKAGPTCVFSQQAGWTAEHDANFAVVPAVPGRVLRFPGKAMHAVPMPVDRWLLNDWEEQALLRKELEDDENHRRPKVERSVILFNTWGKQAPKGVGLDPAGLALKKGGRRWEEWRDKFGEKFASVHCLPRNEWRGQAVEESKANLSGERSSLIKIALMGQKVRRLHPKKNVRLSAQGNVRAALKEEHRPTLITTHHR